MRKKQSGEDRLVTFLVDFARIRFLSLLARRLLSSYGKCSAGWGWALVAETIISKDAKGRSNRVWFDDVVVGTIPFGVL